MSRRGPHRQGSAAADPSLAAASPKSAARPFGTPRALVASLRALFWFLLLVPLVRRWRRRPWWSGVRVALAVGGGAAVFLVGGPAWTTAGAAAVLLALAARRLDDPDRARLLQRLHGAQYFLNGGALAGVEVDLLVREDDLLIVPRRGTGEPARIVTIAAIERIEVAGESYRPVYVSEAKDPPVKEVAVDRRATVATALHLPEGETVEFVYRGPFAKHLAETAAHAVHSVREERLRPGAREFARIAAG
jgi:hypothetical protein